MKDIFGKIKNVLIFLLSFGIILTLYLNDSKITKLEKKIAECEENVIYNNTTDTIEDPCVEYVETKIPLDIEYKEVISYIEKKLTKEDSLDIAKKVLGWIEDYNTTKTYEKVFKNDSSAYIAFSSDIYRNSLLNPKITFTNRYPQYIKVPAEERVEIFAGIGGSFTGAHLSLGLQNKNNILYQVNYDPINKRIGAGINFRILSFK